MPRDVDEMTDVGFKAVARQLCVGHAHSWPIRCYFTYLPFISNCPNNYTKETDSMSMNQVLALSRHLHQPESHHPIVKNMSKGSSQIIKMEI